MDTHGGKANRKEFTALMPGESFLAHIMDIKPDAVVLGLGEGKQLSARFSSLPDARIGQYAWFVVKENDGKGHIALEIAKGQEGGIKGYSHATRDILQNFNVPITAENFELIHAMTENRMPLRKETIQNGLFFKYKTDSVEQAVFLLREEFPPTEAYVEAFADAISNPESLKRVLDRLCEEIHGLPDKAIQNSAESIIRGDEYGDLAACLSVKLTDAHALNGLNAYYNNLLRTAQTLKQLFVNAAQETIRQMVDKLENQLLFMTHIRKTRYFMQIPLVTARSAFQCDVYVYKDDTPQSALRTKADLALSFTQKYLGPVSVLLNKRKNGLAVHIYATRRETEKIIMQNQHKLIDLLKHKGCIVTQMDCQLTDKPFHLLRNLNQPEPPDNEAAPAKRLSFDMRV